MNDEGMIPTYSAPNATSIPEIFRANTSEYPRILLIFLPVFRGIAVEIFDFSSSGNQFCFSILNDLNIVRIVHVFPRPKF